MTKLNLREHGFIDVECLIDNLDFLTGLLKVPLLKLLKKFDGLRIYKLD